MVMPIGIGPNDTMFPASPFVYKEFKDSCMNKYGVEPRPHWVTTNYGGQVWLLSLSLSLSTSDVKIMNMNFFLFLNVKLQHIKTILKRFGSNIIFSNGLRDPYSSAG